MKLTLKHAFAAVLLMLGLAAPVAAGPLEDGYTAYTRGDFATAMRLMRPLADQGLVTAQTVVGLMYYFNYGGGYLSAYMWFKLAGGQGNPFGGKFLKDTTHQETGGQDAGGEKVGQGRRATK